MASNSLHHVGEITLHAGEPVVWEGHTFELVDVTARADGTRQRRARQRACSTSGKIYGPAITTYLRQGIQIGTPSVRAGLTGDVYLTIAGNRPPDVGASEVQLECSSSR